MRRSLLVLCLLVVACGDNKKSNHDAGPDPDGMTEEVCETLPAIPSGTCEVTGSGATKLLKGNILTPGKMFRGGQVAVDAAGKITCVGCDCAAGGETVVTCPDGAISPGLINTHDHITWTQNTPGDDNGVRYDHRHEWRKGQNGKPEIAPPGGANADQISWGELRFLMGGATSIVGSGGRPGLLRNLDQANNQEGLGQPAVRFDTFPLGDSSGTKRTMDCNYGSEGTMPEDIANLDAYEPHTAEGIDANARNEFLCESSMTYDVTAPGVSRNLLLPKTAMIHGIGLTALDYQAMAQASTGLIWSPRSNILLYGDTARVTTADRVGVEIALGTDWMPSGSMNLIRELRCADFLNKDYYNGYFSDEKLWRMVTSNAASVTAMDDVIGVLAPGRVADITIFKGNGKTYRAVIDANPQDIALVMRGGKILYGDDTPVGALAQNCDTVDVCGTAKKLCLMSEVNKTYEQLKAAAGNAYPAFSCEQVPAKEPTCTPKRPTYAEGKTANDSDGDGIANAEDKCPDVFDPIRPMDESEQPDADGDGKGDACDVCPLEANATTCAVPDPNDRDSDTIPNTTDNCPDLANTDQADSDGDGKGNVCDPCPNAANPGTSGCPATIYAIKSGATPLGASVVVENGLVTGRGSNGFFMQVKEGDAGYMGADNSGIFVFTNANTPTLANATVGARVKVTGRVTNFFGQIELDNVTAVDVLAVGPEAPPAPIAVTLAEIKTGGTKAAVLEGVIVALGAGTVGTVDTMFNEYTLTNGTDSVLVDDFLYLQVPLPAVGQAYVATRGILALRNSASKVEPRNAGDLVVGAPGLASFGPALTYARVGTTTNAPTFPAPLTVTLTAATDTATTVAIVSGSGDLTVANVTIPAGSTSAPVPVTAVAQNANVTLTATLGVQSRQANVRVLGAAEVPTTVSLDPPLVGVTVGGTVSLAVTLDVPAPAGGTTVALAVNPTTAGTLPATVLVPADQTTAQFTYTNALATGSATITATLGGSSDSSTVTVATGLDHLVVRQVYGGGGNTGAPINRDFVEIFNPSNMTVSLNGKSVQYASATGTGTWASLPLPATASIPPGGSFLVAFATAGANGAALPAFDAEKTSILMGANGGKIALVDGTTELSGACPMDNIIDLVGYGVNGTGMPPNCFEGGGPTPATSNTLGATRTMGGCTDTDDNAANFTAVAPVPRNSASTPAPCL